VIRNKIFLALACAGIAACSILPQNRGTQERYLLAENLTIRPYHGPSTNARLLVNVITARPFANTNRIVFSKKRGTRGYYQLSVWTEPPVNRITELLISALRDVRIFQSVAPASSGTAAALLLDTDLFEFYHDAIDNPGTVRVGLRAQLVNRPRRTIMAEQTFKRSIPVDAYNAEGAVRSFNKAIEELLNDIITWIGKTVPQKNDLPSA